MALPTRNELLTQVDVRFRELAPAAPARLDPDDPAHDAMIRQWWDAHHEVLSRLTDEAFFGILSDAPRRLDPGDPSHARYIEYWTDMADQIQHGRSGRWDWSNPATVATGIDPDLIEIEGEEAEEEREPVPQDGSVRLEERIEGVKVIMQSLAEPVIMNGLGFKVIEHTMAQIEVLRGLVRDGTFRTYDHWWRSTTYSDAVWDPDDRGEQLAFVRDITLEARIDRADGSLDVNLAGWSTNFVTNQSFGWASRAGH